MTRSDPTRVTLAEVATELAIPRKRARKLLTKHSRWLQARPRTQHGVTTYDATVIDVLRGLLAQEHRQLNPPESDWLSAYLKGQRHA